VSAVLCAAFIFKITYLDPLSVRENQKEAKRKALENAQRDDDGRIVRPSQRVYYN
jgi:hypothetical protein